MGARGVEGQGRQLISLVKARVDDSADAGSAVRAATLLSSDATRCSRYSGRLKEQVSAIDVRVHLPEAIALLEIAEIKTATLLTRPERLERWAELLEREPLRHLRTLEGTEWQLQAQKFSMRADGSPLTIAYNDPVLRAAGLKSDTLGDAMRFFELSEHEAHDVVCYCMHGRTIEGRAASRAVRAIAAGCAVNLNPMAVWGVVAVPLVGCVSYLLTKIV
jgi:hypothetical protein